MEMTAQTQAPAILPIQTPPILPNHQGEVIEQGDKLSKNYH